MISNRRQRSSCLSVILAIILGASFIFCAHPDALKHVQDRIQNLGIFGASRVKSVIGQDGCTPIRVGNYMMWTFGDTILGSWKGDLTVNSTFEDTAVMKSMISNSLAFTFVPDDDTIPDLDFQFYRERGEVAQFIKPFPGEDPAVWRFWAIDGIQIEGTVYVYYMLIYIDKNKPRRENALPIRVMGVGLAEWTMAPQWKPGDPISFKRSAKLFYEGEPVFGDAVIRHGEHLFLIGHGPASANRVPAFVARVRPAMIKKRSGYEFLMADGRWTASLRSAMPIAEDVMGEPSLSYNESLREYLVIYCSLEGHIKGITFTDFDVIKNKKTAVIYIPPSLPALPSRPHLAYYSGKEIFSTDRALYAIYINPAIYQPILLKIPYRYIP